MLVAVIVGKEGRRGNGVGESGCWFVIRGVCYLFFFFSSRRRHTRLQGDWSSDVCSSDLKRGFFLLMCTQVFNTDLQLLEMSGKLLIIASIQDRKSVV